jgi:hypothetical protein
VRIWRRTFWHFYYDGRMRPAAAIPEGSLTKRHLGGEWP